MQKIGFVGAGNMGRAIIEGLLAAGTAPAEALIASDASSAAREALAGRTGVATTDSNRTLVERSEVVVLAVKPQILDRVLEEIAPAIGPQHLIVSIAAGVTLERLAAGLAAGAPGALVRAMPNTPCLVGQGMTVWCAAGALEDDRAGAVSRLFEAVGHVRRVHDEGLIDAVTGLSGSGPAYVFLVLEALADAGVREGLPRALADELACQTVLGAATLARKSDDAFAVLRANVTSPGGTTAAGLAALERGAVRSAFLDAVRAATARSRELS